MVSCGTVTRLPARELVGQWRCRLGPQTCQYVFRENGTFSGYVTEGGALLSNFSGRWRRNGDAIHYEYTNDTVGKIPPGTTDRDTLVEIARNYFVIEAADGSRRRYVRNG